MKSSLLLYNNITFSKNKFVAHTHLVAILGLEVLFLHFLNFLVGYELWTYAKALISHFKHFLGLFETKFVSLTYFVSILVLEVLFSHLICFLVGYELQTYTEALC